MDRPRCFPLIMPLIVPLIVPLLAAASLVACGGVRVRDAAHLNADGNKQYAAGNYPSALETYRRAEVLRPDLPALNYNAANTLNQQGDFARAIVEDQQAVHSTDPTVQDRAYYSMANAYVRQNQLREAIDAYKSALRVNPSDVDAKYNLEVIQRKLDQTAQQNAGQQSAQGGQSGQPSDAQNGQQADQNNGQAGQGQQAADAQGGQAQAGQAAGGQSGQPSASTNGSASGYTGTPAGQAAALDPALKRALAQFDQTGNVDDALRALDVAGEQERAERAGSGGSAQPQGRDW